MSARRADGGGEHRAPVRLGGRATTTDGAILTWSQAEGARGTRWREAIEREGVLVRSLLLETSTDGRPTRLEVTTSAGLLTLHPEPDESALHGNVVTADGIRHLSLDWSPDHEIAVDGSPACIAVMIGWLGASLPSGGEREIPVVVIDDELVPRSGRLLGRRLDEGGWELVDPSSGATERLALDGAGRPVLQQPSTWPLEE